MKVKLFASALISLFLVATALPSIASTVINSSEKVEISNQEPKERKTKGKKKKGKKRKNEVKEKSDNASEKGETKRKAKGKK